jgi:hypothetical protein
MKKLWLIPIVLLIVAFLLWQLWLTLLIGVKEPSYKIIAKKDGYELRKIQPYLAAHVDVVGSYEEATNQGFKILFSYISGNNNLQECLDLKTPMLHEVCKKGASISMTAPVIIEDGAQPEMHRITFILPKEYTLETAPQPRDQRIMIEEVPAKTIAVYRFNWYPTAQRIEQEKKLFIHMLKRDDLCVRSEISLARYNPPFALPFLMRNELIVTVEQNPIQGMACEAMRD